MAKSVQYTTLPHVASHFYQPREKSYNPVNSAKSALSRTAAHGGAGGAFAPPLFEGK